MNFLSKVVLAGAICLAALSGAFAEPKPGGTLIIATASSPRHLNPAVQSGTPVGTGHAGVRRSPSLRC